MQRVAPFLLPAILGACLVLGCFWFAAASDVWSQAGYLHLAFARSLSEGTGFGVESRVAFGDESPLWVALLAGTHLLTALRTPDWMVAGRVLSVGAAIFWAGGLFAFAYGAVKTPRVASGLPFAAAVVLVTMASPDWGAVAFSGSEVLFAGGVACWGFAAASGPFWEALPPWRLLAGCLCAGLAPLLRPEMLFFSICVAPLLFVRWANTPQRFGIKVSSFFAGLLLAVAPGALWLLFTLHTFGTALPNQLAAGRAAPEVFTPREWLTGYAVESPWLIAGCLGAAVWVVLRWRRERNGVGRHLGGALDPSGWAALVWVVLVMIFYLAMHLAVRPEEVLLTVPAATAVCFAGFRARWPLSVAVGTPLVVGYGLVLSVLLTLPAVRVARRTQGDYLALAQALSGIGASDRVALAPVGEVEFLSRHPLVDLSGTLDAAAAPLRWDATDDRQVWWAHGEGARYMVREKVPEPGSTVVWSRDLPASENGDRGGRLVLWRLPPSPTLPEPAGPLPNAD